MRGILYLLDLRQIFPCAWEKKKCQCLVGKSQHRKGRYELNDFYMALPVPRSSLGAHSPHPRPARSVRIFKGRKHICLLLISLGGIGSCSTAALSSCSGGICCSCSHSSSSPLRRRGSAEPLCKGDTGGR